MKLNILWMEFQEEKKRKRIYTPQQAYLKARGYCAYQERSQQEVRNKIYEWGLKNEAVEDIIVKLITENFLNEERFAIAYAGGKFRIKQWGKIKIKQGLKLKSVSEYCIKKGLSTISDRDYLKTIREIIEEKSNTIKEKNPLKKNYKIAQYLISRGFESNLVWDVLKNDEF